MIFPRMTSCIGNSRWCPDLLKACIGEIYCQGRRTAKTQAVCLELGPLWSILEFPSPPSFSLDPPESLGALIRARFKRTWHFLWLWRWSAPPTKRGKSAPGTRLDISYQTAHFFWLEMCRKPIFCPHVAQKCKTCSWLPELQKICFKHQRCSKVTQVFQSRPG